MLGVSRREARAPSPPCGGGPTRCWRPTVGSDQSYGYRDRYPYPRKKRNPSGKVRVSSLIIYIWEAWVVIFKHSQILNGTYDFDEIWQVGCLGESATGMGGYLKIATQGRALHPLSPKNFFEKGSFLKIHQKSQKIPSDILTVATCQPTIHVSLMTLVFPIFQITYAWRGVLQNFFLRFLWLVFRI